MIANPMTKGETFDVFYTRKLDALAARLRECVFDTVFVRGKENPCIVCGCRVFCRGQDVALDRCVLCFPTWLRSRSDLQRDAILKGYPNEQESRQEWEALQSVPTPRQLRGKAPTKAGNEELGKRIRQAREAKGWSKDDLARKIVKRNGQRIAKSSISGYEDGWTNPPKYILEQIEKVLGMEG